MVTPEAKAVLNDVGTEELAHLEIVGTLVKQLMENATPEQIKEAGLDDYYVNHGLGVYPQNSDGFPWTAAGIQSTGNPIVDLYENMAAEEKARSTYEYILNLIDEPDVADPIKFLRQREVVHFQRFGEALRYVQDYMDSKRMFIINTPEML